MIKNNVSHKFFLQLIQRVKRNLIFESGHTEIEHKIEHEIESENKSEKSPHIGVPLTHEQEIQQNNFLLLAVYLWILHSNRPISEKRNFKEWFMEEYDQNVLKSPVHRKGGSILPLNAFFELFLHNLCTDNSKAKSNLKSNSKSNLKSNLNSNMQPQPPVIPFWNSGTLTDSRGSEWNFVDLNLAKIPENAIFSRKPLPILPPKPSIPKLSKIFPDGPSLFTVFEIYEHYHGQIDEELLGDLFERLMHDETKHTTGAFYTPSYICLKIGRDLLTDILRPLFPSWDSNSQVADIPQEITKTLTHFSDSQCRILIPRIHQTLINLKVLDPSLGAGHFLIAMDSLLIDIYRAIWEFLQMRNITGLILIPKIIPIHIPDYSPPYPVSNLNNLRDMSSWSDFEPVAHLLRLWYIYPHILYGVDINSRATRVAKWRLFCKLFDTFPPEKTLEEYYRNLTLNIHVGNALLGLNSWESVKDVLDSSSKIRISSSLGKAEKKLMDLTNNLNFPLQTLAEMNSTNKQIRELNSQEKFNSQIKFNQQSLIYYLVTLLRDVRLYLKQPQTGKLYRKNEKIKGIGKIGKIRDNMGNRDIKEFLDNLNRMIRDYLNVVYLKSKNLSIGEKSIPQEGLFHWIGEFPELFTIPTPQYATIPPQPTPNGFHLILGNPPYGNLLQPIEKSIIGDTLGIFKEISSLFIERAMDLTATRGSFGYLTSYTITFNKQLSRLRHNLLHNFTRVRLATFDRDRCRMFENMTQSVSILQCSEKKNKKRLNDQLRILLTTQIYRELPSLDKLEYQIANSYLLGKSIGSSASQNHRIPKIGIPAMTQFLSQMADHYEQSQYQVGDLVKAPTIISSKAQSISILSKNPDPFGGIWIRISGNYWYNAWNRPPYYGTQIAYLPLITPDRNIHSFLLGLINSSLYYVWFRIYSDGRHMNSDILRGIPLPILQQPSSQPKHRLSFSDTLAKFGNLLEVYTAKLMEELFDHFDSDRNRFRTSEIKALLDIGDHIFGIIFDLSPEDIAFIQNFEPTIRGRCKITPAFSKTLHELINRGDFSSSTSKDLLTFQSMMDQII
ncbi:MAG: Eco57I restriction-modification methylase domain-containing protein [Promethearchaeota archaeon]